MIFFHIFIKILHNRYYNWQRWKLICQFYKIVSTTTDLTQITENCRCPHNNHSQLIWPVNKMSLSDLNNFLKWYKKYFYHNKPERYIVVRVFEAGSHLHVGDRISHTAGTPKFWIFLQLSSENTSFMDSVRIQNQDHICPASPERRRPSATGLLLRTHSAGPVSQICFT